MGVNFQYILIMPDNVIGTTRLCTHVILRQKSTCGPQQWEPRTSAFIGGHIFGDNKPPLAAHKSIDVHQWRAIGGGVITRPLNRSLLLKQIIGDIGKGWGGLCDFGHDFTGVGIIPSRAHSKSWPKSHKDRKST